MISNELHRFIQSLFGITNTYDIKVNLVAFRNGEATKKQVFECAVVMDRILYSTSSLAIMQEVETIKAQGFEKF